VFAPIFARNTNLRITGPLSFEHESLKSIIETQLSYRYWPVRAGELSAHIEFNQIKETTLDLGDGLTVASKYLNHPILCLGYRFYYKGKSIAAIFDHEPYRNLYRTDPSGEGYDEKKAQDGELVAFEENKKITDFIRGADIVIHDAQYSQTEYTSHQGWGHASYEHAFATAAAAAVKKLVFYHHDPSHTDKQLKQLEKTYAKKRQVKNLMAKEGLLLQA